MVSFGQAPAQKAPAQKAKTTEKVDKPNQERKPKQGKGDGERRPRNGTIRIALNPFAKRIPVSLDPNF